jgi:hypothetical protein
MQQTVQALSLPAVILSQQQSTSVESFDIYAGQQPSLFIMPTGLSRAAPSSCQQAGIDVTDTLASPLSTRLA